MRQIGPGIRSCRQLGLWCQVSSVEGGAGQRYKQQWGNQEGKKRAHCVGSGNHRLVIVVGGSAHETTMRLYRFLDCQMSWSGFAKLFRGGEAIT